MDLNDTNYNLNNIELPKQRLRPRQMNLFYKPNPFNKAKDFADKYNLTTAFVLKLFKQYGMNKVLSLNSFLSDYPVNEKGYIGLIIWRLKQGDRTTPIPIYKDKK